MFLLRLHSAGHLKTVGGNQAMPVITRYGRFGNFSALQDQVNRAFENVTRGHAEDASIAAWAPAVDIYETENELVIKADLPDVNENDIDVRVENNMLTIGGERKFDQKVKED